MFQPIHPRYQTLHRRPVRDREAVARPNAEDRSLDAMYRRIDEDLADR